jgi:hypothetical protein
VELFRLPVGGPFLFSSMEAKNARVMARPLVAKVNPGSLKQGQNFHGADFAAIGW